MMMMCNRLPSITVRGGVIGLKKSVTTALGLVPGDVVNFFEDRGELYMCRTATADTVGDYVGRCVPSNSGRSGYLRINSRSMSNTLLKYCGEEKEVKLAIGDVVSHPDRGVCLTIITRLKL